MLKNFIEIVFGTCLFFNAILFIPQALKIYKTKSSKEVSFITFLGFNLMQIFTILHGYIREDYLLVLGTSLSFVFCGIVTGLILRYREKL